MRSGVLAPASGAKAPSRLGARAADALRITGYLAGKLGVPLRPAAIGGITEEILNGPVRPYAHRSLAAFGLTAGQALPAYRERCPTATTDAPLFGPMLGNDPPQELARILHAASVAFASTDDPVRPRYELR